MLELKQREILVFLPQNAYLVIVKIDISCWRNYPLAVWVWICRVWRQRISLTSLSPLPNEDYNISTSLEPIRNEWGRAREKQSRNGCESRFSFSLTSDVQLNPNVLIRKLLISILSSSVCSCECQHKKHLKIMLRYKDRASFRMEFRQLFIHGC